MTALAWVCAVALIWSGRLCRHNRRLDESAQRHPAGTVPIRLVVDEAPFSARTICGHKIFGDSLGDLLSNEIYHAQQCPHVAREDAA